MVHKGYLKVYQIALIFNFAEGGISIPCEYRSYLTLLNASKFFTDVKAYGDVKHFEMPYVCKVRKGQTLAPQAQMVFKFKHPNWDIKKQDKNNSKHNERHAVLKYTVSVTGTIHGLLGYFDTKLYKDVYLSCYQIFILD